jgi:hypothetical protein
MKNEPPPPGGFEAFGCVYMIGFLISWYPIYLTLPGPVTTTVAEVMGRCVAVTMTDVFWPFVWICYFLRYLDTIPV